MQDMFIVFVFLMMLAINLVQANTPIQHILSMHKAEQELRWIRPDIAIDAPKTMFSAGMVLEDEDRPAMILMSKTVSLLFNEQVASRWRLAGTIADYIVGRDDDEDVSDISNEILDAEKQLLEWIGGYTQTPHPLWPEMIHGDTSPFTAADTKDIDAKMSETFTEKPNILPFLSPAQIDAYTEANADSLEAKRAAFMAKFKWADTSGMLDLMQRLEDIVGMEGFEWDPSIVIALSCMQPVQEDSYEIVSRLYSLLRMGCRDFKHYKHALLNLADTFRYYSISDGERTNFMNVFLPFILDGRDDNADRLRAIQAFMARVDELAEISEWSNENVKKVTTMDNVCISCSDIPFTLLALQTNGVPENKGDEAVKREKAEFVEKWAANMQLDCSCSPYKAAQQLQGYEMEEETFSRIFVFALQNQETKLAQALTLAISREAFGALQELPNTEILTASVFSSDSVDDEATKSKIIYVLDFLKMLIRLGYFTDIFDIDHAQQWPSIGRMYELAMDTYSVLRLAEFDPEKELQGNNIMKLVDEFEEFINKITGEATTSKACLIRLLLEMLRNVHTSASLKNLAMSMLLETSHSVLEQLVTEEVDRQDEASNLLIPHDQTWLVPDARVDFVPFSDAVMKDSWLHSVVSDWRQINEIDASNLKFLPTEVKKVSRWWKDLIEIAIAAWESKEWARGIPKVPEADEKNHPDNDLLTINPPPTFKQCFKEACNVNNVTREKDFFIDGEDADDHLCKRCALYNQYLGEFDRMIASHLITLWDYEETVPSPLPPLSLAQEAKGLGSLDHLLRYTNYVHLSKEAAKTTLSTDLYQAMEKRHEREISGLWKLQFVHCRGEKERLIAILGSIPVKELAKAIGGLTSGWENVADIVENEEMLASLYANADDPAGREAVVLSERIAKCQILIKYLKDHLRGAKDRIMPLLRLFLLLEDLEKKMEGKLQEEGIPDVNQKEEKEDDEYSITLDDCLEAINKAHAKTLQDYQQLQDEKGLIVNLLWERQLIAEERDIVNSVAIELVELADTKLKAKKKEREEGEDQPIEIEINSILQDQNAIDTLSAAFSRALQRTEPAQMQKYLEMFTTATHHQHLVDALALPNNQAIKPLVKATNVREWQDLWRKFPDAPNKHDAIRNASLWVEATLAEVLAAGDGTLDCEFVKEKDVISAWWDTVRRIIALEEGTEVIECTRAKFDSLNRLHTDCMATDEVQDKVEWDEYNGTVKEMMEDFFGASDLDLDKVLERASNFDDDLDDDLADDEELRREGNDKADDTAAIMFAFHALDWDEWSDDSKRVLGAVLFTHHPYPSPYALPFLHHSLPFLHHSLSPLPIDAQARQNPYPLYPPAFLEALKAIIPTLTTNMHDPKYRKLFWKACAYDREGDDAMGWRQQVLDRDWGKMMILLGEYFDGRFLEIVSHKIQNELFEDAEEIGRVGLSFMDSLVDYEAALVDQYVDDVIRSHEAASASAAEAVAEPTAPEDPTATVPSVAVPSIAANAPQAPPPPPPPN